MAEDGGMWLALFGPHSWLTCDQHFGTFFSRPNNVGNVNLIIVIFEEVVCLLAYRKAIARESRMRLFSWWDNPPTKTTARNVGVPPIVKAGKRVAHRDSSICLGL